MTRRFRLAASVAATAVCVSAPAAAQDFDKALAASKVIFEVRPRFESVDQTGFAKDAEALTVRTRIGVETGAWNGFKAVFEVEDVHDFGSGHYNDGVPPAEPYPVIADPEVTEINRAQISWAPSKAFQATIGRQRINLDDQRFVGSVAWRQDEQTFDAAKADVSVGKLKASVAYLDKINRVFGDKLDWDSESWLFNATYAASDLITPTVFVYALDFDNAAASSTLTKGVRVTGKAKAGDIAWSWAASWANQEEHGNNPANFSLDYWEVDLSAAKGPVTVRGAYESLEGNGARGFATPLATLHAFQGWADVFLTTPANGIEDASLTLTWRTPVAAPHFSKLTLTAVYHDFQAQRGGADLGSEWDLQATAQITKRVSALAKFADYDGVAGFPSRQKLWLGFEFKF